MKRTRFILTVLVSVLALAFTEREVNAAEKQTIYNSPYVDFAPDGKAWTTHAGDSNIKTYPHGTTVSTGIESSLRELNVGEHYYWENREGEVPVGKWVVEWSRGRCIHRTYPTERAYHDLTYRTQICTANYFSGWLSFCADCGERLGGMHVYMSKEAAESIDYVEARKGKPMVESGMDYYYICPFCTNLEMGAPFAHECKFISYNRYQVVYDRNHADEPRQSGLMSKSYHYYNNATEYDGKVVTPVTHLTLNNYKRVGYEFVGWNTKPDGSGISFTDGAEIENLSKADFKREETWLVENGRLDNGTVTLYAQWRRSESTLRIHLEGGTYEGQSGPVEITQEFETSYTIDMDELVPPAGYEVTFHANGGVTKDYESGEQISKLEAPRSFSGWIMTQPFKGQLSRNKYSFIGPDGCVDEIEATYQMNSIVLPNCIREGYSFGGWYTNAALTRPVGAPGDTYTPTGPVTLYASWVELVLESRDNYTANGGKGAVDLTWEQPDSGDKAYKVYQSTNGTTWEQVGSATDIGSLSVPGQTINYTGETKQYTVPYTGTYNIYTYGAQGGRAGTYNGGKGGQTYGLVYLDAGEKLTLTAGGQNGYNGGGDGDPYGNGGGASTVVSDKKGTLFIAGGGGGATTKTAGGEGGAQASLRADRKAEGEDGGAGGGAGYIGGTGGELEFHYCEPECSGLSVAQQSFYDAGVGGGSGGFGLSCSPGTNSYAGNIVVNSPQWSGVTFRVGNSQNYLSTPDTGELNFRFTIGYMFGPYIDFDSRIKVYDKDTGEVIYSFEPKDASHTESTVTEHMCDKGASCGLTGHKRTIATWTYTEPYVTGSRVSTPGIGWQNHNGTYDGKPRSESISLDFNVPIPEDVEGVYLGAEVLVYGTSNGTSHVGGNIYDVSYSYAACGYEDGEVIASSPAYGGSNYVAEERMNSFSATSGSRSGDGQITISAESIGYFNEQYLNGVSAPDLAVPNGIKSGSVKKTPLGSNRVVVSWEEPLDNGTKYYHKVTSHAPGSSTVLCTSNITLNTLTTGVKGYYYIVDSKTDTVVADAYAAGENPSFTEQRKATVSVAEEVKYLHLAPVDKAGNIGGTLHVKIQADPGTPEGGGILWNLSTGPVSVEDTENTHPAGADRWYVKADGATPFALMYDAFLEGTASLYYQPNYSIFHTKCEAAEGENILFTRNHAVSDDTIISRAESLVYSTKDNPVLMQYPYMVTERSNQNTRLRTMQKFTLSNACHGKEVSVYPRTGAEYGSEVVYSDETADREHTIILIGDGEAPVITGLDREPEGTELLEISAEDALSGVGDFYVEVINVDNNDKITCYPEADGVVRIDLSADELMFDGDLQIRAVAVDNVGNETEIMVSATEFAMSAVIERILSPHDPIFKCGESGVLTVVTYGYADRIVVEFPPELETQEVYSKEFVYPAPAYMAEEKIQFMVPLTATDDQYVVKVTSYKGGREMERSEPIMVVNGTVLQELRTRLR